MVRPFLGKLSEIKSLCQIIFLQPENQEKVHSNKRRHCEKNRRTIFYLRNLERQLEIFKLSF